MSSTLCISFRFVQPFPLFPRVAATRANLNDRRHRCVHFKRYSNAACSLARGKPLLPEYGRPFR